MPGETKKMPAKMNQGTELVPSKRKLAARRRLRDLAAKLSDGSDCHVQQYIIPGVTLGRVREELSQIQGSLAEAVVDERSR